MQSIQRTIRVGTKRLSFAFTFILGFLFVFFFFILNKILFYVPEFLTGIIEYLGVDTHFSNIARGVIDSRDIMYFLTLLGFMLYLSVVSLERRKW